MTIADLNESLARGDELAVRSAIAQLRGIIPLDTMRATAATFRADLGIVGTARNAALRSRQNEAIATIQRDLVALADELDRTAARLSGQLAAIDIPERETITKARAIMIYAAQLIPQIALGIAIDWVLIFGAFFVGMLRDAMPAPKDDVSDISLADARRIRRELAKLINETDEVPALLPPALVEPGPADPLDQPPPVPPVDPAWAVGQVMSDDEQEKDLAA